MGEAARKSKYDRSFRADGWSPNRSALRLGSPWRRCAACRPFDLLLFSSFRTRRTRGDRKACFTWPAGSKRGPFRLLVLVPRRGSLSQNLDSVASKSSLWTCPPDRPGRHRPGRSGPLRGFHASRTACHRSLHTDGPRNTLYAAMIGRLRRSPVVWHVRSSSRDPYDRLLCLLPSKIILVADALESRFPSRSQRGKCVTIHNGVDLQRFAPAMDSPPSPDGLDTRSVLVRRTPDGWSLKRVNST